jgi:hypothetical protein
LTEPVSRKNSVESGRSPKMPVTPALITNFVNPFTKYENHQGKGKTPTRAENAIANLLICKINKLNKI